MVKMLANSSRSQIIGRHTKKSLRIVAHIEQEIVRQEIMFGRERLLQTVKAFGGDAYSTHTTYYRRVIRETAWPNGKWVGSMHSDFLRGFEYSSLAYVWAGFEALRFFTSSNELSIDQVYEDALVAESLRGQFGKSSPDGLDRRLMELEEHFLDNFGDEHDLILLCTLLPPILPAETALVKEFADFQELFPLPPTVDDILAVSDHHQVKVWQFLRRYVRWNVDAIAPMYCSFNSTNHMKIENDNISRQRDFVLRKLPKQALELVDSIISLNILNLVLEPAFSFKGCVGLPLGMVFRSVNHVERRLPLDQVSILLGKMSLFTLAQQRSEYE